MIEIELTIDEIEHVIDVLNAVSDWTSQPIAAYMQAELETYKHAAGLLEQ